MRRAVTRRSRPAAVALVGLAVTLPTLLLGSGAGAAQDLVSFEAVAAADGIRVATVRPEAPLSENVLDAASPAAQSRLGNISGSSSYASFAYPGETPLSAPGLLSGPTGQSLPSYPVIATATSPATPEDEVTAGPLTMKAQAGPERASSLATLDGASGGSVGRVRAQATSSLAKATGTLKGDASVEVTGVDVAGVLRLGSVRSRATAIKVGGGKVTTTSSTELGELTVAGVRVGLSQKGLVLAGATVPLPDSSPVTAPLRDAGVSVRLLAPEALKDGVRSGGVAISIATATPDGGAATVTYLLGAVRATVRASLVEPDAVLASAPAAPPETETDSAPAAPAPAAEAPDPDSVTPDTETPADVSGAEGTTVPEAAPAAPAAEEPSVALPVVGRIVNTAFGELDARYFYLVLVLASAVAIGSQHVLRRLGVRS